MAEIAGTSRKGHPDRSVLGGEVGLWSWALNSLPAPRAKEAVAEIEELCYVALWFGEVLGREASTKASILLSATRRLAPTTDREEALRLACSHLSRYLQLPNYRNSWLSQGFQEENLFGDGSERLAEELVAWGSEGNIRERVHEHLSAGAHQVCVQVVTDGRGDGLRERWRSLAPALLG